MIYKNVANQKIALFAYDINTNAPLVGWGAAISGFISKDGAAAASLANNTLTEVTGGIYIINPSQTETNADLLVGFGFSASGNVAVDPVVIYTSTQTPNVNAVQIGSSTSAADNAASFFTTGYSASNSSIGYVNRVTGVTSENMTYDAWFENVLGFIAGRASGANGGASTISFRNYTNTREVLKLTVDTYGNRSSTSGAIS